MNESSTPRETVHSPNGVGLRPKLNEIYSSIFHRRNIPQPFDFDSYSQFGEDMYIRRLLPFESGTYVDIGSGHPIRGSNTYAFYKSGWRGLLVDPIASNIAESRKFRREDTCIQACAGDDDRLVTFFEYEIYEYSTTSEARVNELRSIGFEPKDVYTSPTRKLRDLGIAATPQDAVFLSIDVEGMELEVLEGNNWDSFKPAVIAIEEWEAPLGKSSPVLEYLSAKGYVLVAILGPTAIYEHREYRFSA